MKYHVPLVMISLMLLPCALGTTHLYSGADSYGKGLSYPVHNATTNISDNIPAFAGMSAIVGLYAGNYPGAYSPIFLGYSPVSSSPVPVHFNNTSDVNSLIGSIWTPYSIYHTGYTPMDVMTLFPESVSTGMGYESDIKAINDSVMSDQQPEPAESDVSSLNQFMKDDWKPGSPDPDDYSSPGEFHTRLVSFLNDDSIPSSPLM